VRVEESRVNASFSTFWLRKDLQRRYVRQTLPVHHQDSVGGEIIAISDLSSGTQEKAVPPRIVNGDNTFTLA
jgi:hypothetical protein